MDVVRVWLPPEGGRPLLEGDQVRMATAPIELRVRSPLRDARTPPGIVVSYCIMPLTMALDVATSPLQLMALGIGVLFGSPSR